MTRERTVERFTLKARRARAHIASLEEQVRSYLETRPYQVAIKRDPSTRRLIYYIGGIAPTPEQVALVAGEALHQLRSALDHLAHDLVVAGSGGKASTQHVYFPIADDLAKYKKLVPQYTGGMIPMAVDAIGGLKPYKGGNDALWQLNRLNNIDKHRLLVTVGSALASVDIGQVMSQTLRKVMEPGEELPSLQMFVQPADRMFPLKVGDELFIDGPDAEPVQGLQFKFEVAFGEPGIVAGEALLGGLNRIAGAVEGVLPILEPFL